MDRKNPKRGQERACVCESEKKKGRVCVRAREKFSTVVLLYQETFSAGPFSELSPVCVRERRRKGVCVRAREEEE